MTDFQQARRAMVDGQVRAIGVSDSRLLAALGRVPRELFVPEARRAMAYIDRPLPLGEDTRSGRFLPPAGVFARLVQLAAIEPADRVLDVGVGTGYSTAVLAAVAANVVGLETDAGLAATATTLLADAGLENVRLLVGGIEALAGEKFDAIVIEGAMDREPVEFFELLAPGGRLVVPLRRQGVGVATVYVAGEAGVTARSEFNATLPGLEPPPVRDEFVF